MHSYTDSKLYIFHDPVLESDPELYNDALSLHFAGPISQINDHFQYGVALCRRRCC